MPKQSNMSNMNQVSSGSTKGYLDRRHFQSKERVEKLRKEKLEKDNSHLSFKPEISKNSKKIIEKIANDVNILVY